MIVRFAGRKQVAQEVLAANATAQRVVGEAGLTVLHGAEPTDQQVRLAALHTREDAAMMIALQGATLLRLGRIAWWLRAIFVVVALNLLVTCAHAAPSSSAALRQFEAMIELR